MNKKIILVLPLMFGLFACGNKENKGKLVTREEFLKEIELFKVTEDKVPEFFEYKENFSAKERLYDHKETYKSEAIKIKAQNGEKVFESHTKNSGHMEGEETIFIVEKENLKINTYTLSVDNKGISCPQHVISPITAEDIENRQYSHLNASDNLAAYANTYIPKIELEYLDDAKDYETNNYYINKKGNVTSFSIEKKWTLDGKETRDFGHFKVNSTIKFKDNYLIEYLEKYDYKSLQGEADKHRETKIKSSEFKGDLTPRKNVDYEVINLN